MTPLRRKLILAFGLLGLAASSTSSYVHYKLLADPSYTSFCDVNPAVSCTQAYLSRYGSLWGVPVALAGVLFFVLVLVIAGLTAAERSRARESAPGYLFALSTIGLAFVIYLGWASYVQLRTFCLLCAATYVAVISIFLISAGATTFPMTTMPRRASKDVRSFLTSPIALVTALLLVVGAALALAYFPRESATTAEQAAAALPPLTEQQRADIEKWWAVQPKVDLPIPSDGAKVLVVKFSVPADLRGLQAGARKVSVRGPGAVCGETLPARGRVQPQSTEQPLRLVRGGGCRDHGPLERYG
jgi:uncharacterized membrane protein